MRIRYDGNVGIGTSSPAYKLDVQGEVQISNGSALRWKDSGGTSYNLLYLYSDNNVYLSAPVTSSSLIFRGVGFAERARIDSSGNLLVGTTSAPSNIGLSTKFKTSNGIQYGESQRTVIANPATKTFTVTGGGNGSGTYFAIEANQYNGYVSAYFYCINASGIWTVNQVSRGTSGTAPTITITNNNSATVTVAVAVNGSYSGGFITIDMSLNYVSVA
jgi:hypothetical protein